MNINFHYWSDFWNFPIDKQPPNDIFDLNARTIVLLYNELSKKYPEIKFNSINHRIKYPNLNDANKFFQKTHDLTGLWLSPYLVTIENPVNGKYFIYSKQDNLDSSWSVVRQSKYIDKCVEIFAQVGVHTPANVLNSKPIQDIFPDFKYTPISHHVGGIDIYNYIEEITANNLTQNRIIPKKLHFRCGSLYGLRLFLSNDTINIFDFKTEREWNAKKYLDELNQYSINIDITAQAEISCRTLEIMGMGMALIRPKLVIQYHNKLIPNHHYYALDESNCNSIKDLGDLYYEALQNLKKDKDYCIFLSNNGRKWYEDNCRLDNYMKILIDRIDINKLLV